MPHAQGLQKHRAAILFALGGALGAVAFLAVFGLAPLDGTNDALVRGGFIERDIQQHYAGWLFLRQAPLGWPLGVAQGIGSGGLSVAFTDSVPLVAVLCRLLSPVLPATFQYFGWCTLLFFILQGGFAALLCGLFADGLCAPLLGAGLFMLSPVLWERALRHTALGAQWLVLAALYGYFAARRGRRGAWGLLFAVNVLGIGIHPYFVPMTFAITLALVVEDTLRTHRPAAFGLLGLNLAAAVALGWALGLFYGQSGGGDGALYGYFGLNLNALWNPAGVGGMDWSLFLPIQNQVNGNYDAFAYLGLGVWVGLAALLYYGIKGWRAGLRQLRAHWPLAAVCAVLTAFAVSHIITANGATLAVLPLPERLIQFFSVFRSGGRLFWPVYYLLVLLAFVLVMRLGAGRLSAVLAAVLLAVQLVDIAPGLLGRRQAVQDAYAAPAFPTALTSDFWTAAAGYAHITSMDNLQDDPLHLALFAADQGMTTNDPFAARHDAAALAAERAALLDELAAGTLRPDTLYLFADEGYFLQAVEPVRAQAWCGAVTGPDGACWYAIAPGLQDAAFDAACTPYDEAWPLRLADYTDALWNRGVLDGDRRVVCFRDSPFARARLDGAAALRAGGQDYTILQVDDSDPGWLMVTLDIADATVLWDAPLEAVR